MVKGFFVLILILKTITAYAITPDELRALSADESREQLQRSNRANTGAVDTLLPNTAKQPSSSKYSNNSNSVNAQSSEQPASKNSRYKSRATAKKNQGLIDTSSSKDSGGSDANIYIPPPRQNTASGQSIISDAIPATLVFGIRLGTWIPATLSRDTSSAEPGTVELTISEDIIGDRRTLPMGTVLFANKSLNNGTKRMEMTVTNGITPSGQEFKLRGLIFDPLKVSGLTGNYVVDDKAIAKHGLQKGTVAAIGAATQSLGGANPLAAAGGAATQTVISDTSGAVDYNAPTAIIYVPPQPLIIRVEERF